jgi:predicted PurR-regulated permease PerM
MAIPPPAHPYSWSFRRVIGATLVLVLVAVGFWLLYRFSQVVFILFVAIMLGTVIRPVVAWLHRRGLPRKAALALVYVMLLALLIAFVVLVIPMMVEQGTAIVAVMPGTYQSLRQGMGSNPNQLVVRLSEFLPASLAGLERTPQTGEQMLASAGQAFGYATSVAQFVLLAAVILILTFHWTLYGPRIIQSWLHLLPRDRRESIRDLVTATEAKVGFYLAGQGVLCLIVGFMALGAYLLIGLPNALVLALVAGVLEAVPMVGPLLGALPAALVALSLAPSKLVWVIVATIAIQQVENSLLVPRVMRRAVGVNPFVSLLAIFAFGTLFGIAGALMAIPIAAIVQLLLDRFVFHPGTLQAEASAGRDDASRLRYEAQDLAQDLRRQARVKKQGPARWVQQTDLVMDEIESLTTDLDSLLAVDRPAGAP